jgi:ABC-type iron transport system FetAB ATPase subunit
LIVKRLGTSNKLVLLVGELWCNKYNLLQNVCKLSSPATSTIASLTQRLSPLQVQSEWPTMGLGKSWRNSFAAPKFHLNNIDTLPDTKDISSLFGTPGRNKISVCNVKVHHKLLLNQHSTSNVQSQNKRSMDLWIWSLQSSKQTTWMALPLIVADASTPLPFSFFPHVRLNTCTKFSWI